MDRKGFELLLKKTADFLSCSVVIMKDGHLLGNWGNTDRQFAGNCIKNFDLINHPVIISDQSHFLCEKCKNKPVCSLKREFYVPVAGKQFGAAFQWAAPVVNTDGLLSFLEELVKSAVELLEAVHNEKEKEFLHQVVCRQGEWINRGLLMVSAEEELLYHNTLARNNHMMDTYLNSIAKSSESHNVGMSDVPFSVIPIHCGKEFMGNLVVSQSQNSAEAEWQQRVQNEKPFQYIVGRDASLTNCISIAEQVSYTNSTILIRGESGTGKERFAYAIHQNSYRKDRPFVAINCAAIPESLLESELFGYEEGSFTGAKRGGKKGKIEMADGGTLFLDEIGDMPPALQAKLLRVLQNKKIERIGSVGSVSIDVRIICATNRNLEDLIKQNRFREDLFYRINVIPIYLPPLRTRYEDIVLLLHYYTRKYCVLMQKDFKTFSPELLEQLKQYEWKGNVRELENIVEYSVMMCSKDEITFEHIPAYLQKRFHQTAEASPPSGDGIKNISLPQAKQELNRLLEQYGHSTEAKREIAAHMGVSLATLYRRLKKYGM